MIFLSSKQIQICMHLKFSILLITFNQRKTRWNFLFTLQILAIFVSCSQNTKKFSLDLMFFPIFKGSTWSSKNYKVLLELVSTNTSIEIKD